MIALHIVSIRSRCRNNGEVINQWGRERIGAAHLKGLSTAAQRARAKQLGLGTVRFASHMSQKPAAAGGCRCLNWVKVEEGLSVAARGAWKAEIVNCGSPIT